jgi:UDP-N-acetyl-D-glucosamine dehydrogenase
VLLPRLERSGLKAGRDFLLAYSPEREDPGSRGHSANDIPKVVGGLTPRCLARAREIYDLAAPRTVPVSSLEAAEATKLMENIFRCVNIAMVNELKVVFEKMGIDVWEVIAAAKTKPFGFQAFYPGPGIGGHCIPLDPFYLEHIAKMYDFDLSMIHAAGHINMRMPHYMYIKINSALNRQKKPVNGSKLLFLGVAYKPNIDDERESPAIEIIDEVVKKGGVVSYNDPHIPRITTHGGHSFASVALSPETLADADVVVITTRHAAYDWDMIQKHARLMVDLQNAYAEGGENIYKL